jgi:hypothetical protein
LPSTNREVLDRSKWSAPMTVDDRAPLTGVSCTSSSFCVAVDDAGYVLSYDGRSWSVPAPLSPVEPHDGRWGFNSVDCASTSFCVAVGNSVGSGIWVYRRR